MLEVIDLYDLRHTVADGYLKRFTYPWQALEGIGAFICELGASLGKDYKQVSPQVWIHSSAKVAPTAYIAAPAIICADAEVRHGAFIRGNALVGCGCVVGNSAELKNVILFDGVQVPHYNYVGDSILGYKAHMGAGSITSNVKSDNTAVVVHGADGKEYPTGRRKVGAFLGDYAEIGCNSVLNPGTVIGRNSSVYPLSSVRGEVPRGCILKTGGKIVKKD